MNNGWQQTVPLKLLTSRLLPMTHEGTFVVESISTQKAYQLSDLKIGINDVSQYLVKLDENRNVEFVIDKVCDHKGGKLVLKGEKAVCPMHDWELNLNDLTYNNSHICKQKVDYAINDAGAILVSASEKSLVNPFKKDKKGKVNIRWLNHATVYIECNGKSIITDPWLFGPAFMTGWWLSQPSPDDSIELLQNADYIFLSHNHPDHLHAETLSVLPRDKAVIIGDFTSKSCEKLVRSLGFINVTALPFNEIYSVTTGFQISILKSGDFRDDAGLYVCANGHEILLTVDSNALNSYVLPRQIDLLMTSFAGGASGFPLCFDNYTLKEKRSVITRNRNASRFAVGKYLKTTRPAFYHPYAGMFAERSARDGFIKENNTKNCISDYTSVCSQNNTILLEPKAGNIIVLENGFITSLQITNKQLNNDDPQDYIDNIKDRYPYNSKIVIEYLRNSGYGGKQILQLIPVSDDFTKIVDDVTWADFGNGIFKTISPVEMVESDDQSRVMQLRIRPEILMYVIQNRLPWEDFAIGFQMRVKRSPNKYESDFWYHFTNINVGKQNFRFSPHCGACTSINQNPVYIKSLTGSNKEDQVYLTNCSSA